MALNNKNKVATYFRSDFDKNKSETEKLKVEIAKHNLASTELDSIRKTNLATIALKHKKLLHFNRT